MIVGAALVGGCAEGTDDERPKHAGQVSSGWFAHTCAALDAGGVQCWGAIPIGARRTQSLTPVDVTGIADARQVAAGQNHTCALLELGTVTCWGLNGDGELGNGCAGGTVSDGLCGGADRATPGTPVALINDAAMIAAGPSHTCALRADGSVSCWGVNTVGQCGDGTTTDMRAKPVQVVGTGEAIAIGTGVAHTCAALYDGTVECWGYNESGQLGDGTKLNSATPVEVPGISSAVALAAGFQHTCAVLAEGTVQCWGGNGSGALCATRGDGTQDCSMSNGGGQLGDGTTTDSLTPVEVIGFANATAITAGVWHSCALLADGTVACWGKNDHGQLGDGAMTDSASPVAVAGIEHAVAISSGATFACALIEGGAIKCWGNNQYGQLGDGTTRSRPTPVPVKGF